MSNMTMRDKIAAVIVSNRACDNWHEPLPADLELADAIIAALPGMVPSLEWVKTTGHWQATDVWDGRYEVFSLSRGKSTAHYMVRGHGIQIGDGSSMGSDIAAANANNRAAVCQAMGL